MKLVKPKLALSHLRFAGHFLNNRLTMWLTPQRNFSNSPHSNSVLLKSEFTWDRDVVHSGHYQYSSSLETPILKISLELIQWTDFSESWTVQETHRWNVVIFSRPDSSSKGSVWHRIHLPLEHGRVPPASLPWLFCAWNETSSNH